MQDNKLNPEHGVSKKPQYLIDLEEAYLTLTYDEALMVNEFVLTLQKQGTLSLHQPLPRSDPENSQ